MSQATLAMSWEITSALTALQQEVMYTGSLKSGMICIVYKEKNIDVISIINT